MCSARGADCRETLFPNHMAYTMESIWWWRWCLMVPLRLLCSVPCYGTVLRGYTFGIYGCKAHTVVAVGLSRRVFSLPPRGVVNVGHSSRFPEWRGVHYQGDAQKWKAFAQTFFPPFVLSHRERFLLTGSSTPNNLMSGWKTCRLASHYYRYNCFPLNLCFSFWF